MKRINNIARILFLAGLTTMTSCQKDFLDRKPLNLVSEETVWQDPALIKLSINEFYTFLNTGFTNTYLPGAITDDLQLIGSEERKLIGYLSGDFFNTTFPERNLWKDAYAQIRKVNYFIGRVEQTNVLNDTDRKTLLGQARFFRAFIYFQLFSNFKDVPLITRLQPIEEAEDKPLKVSHEDGMAFIAAELEKAATELPSTYSKEEWGRITKDAALAFLTRVLIWDASPLNNEDNSQQRWQKAADAASRVISGQAYDLQKEYTNVFLTKNIMTRPEVILESRYNGLKGERQHAFDKNNSSTGFGGKGINCPTQDLVDAYEMANGKAITEQGSGYDKAKPYIGRDPRFDKAILHNESLFKDRKIETFTGGLDMPRTNPTPTGYYIRKFIDEKFDYNKDASAGSSTNWVIMRYAEVLLNFAEAQNEATGPTQAVYEAVNAIRKRVNMPELAKDLNQEQMRVKIRNERRIELAFEDNIRYQDLRRWKAAETMLNKSVSGVTITKNNDGSFKYAPKSAGTRVFTTKNYWMPIPLVELGVNTNLNPQNPGW
ncbi:RagB/SusD family nutrient uptake outer membrane protein [Sphingobacterium psychroaquaticum]|uniref:Starch-binding associating with outer membrane n=1 Tax=Sphingobacterium psychroaquaticum TaxID=561061 RepID=A0A1X7JRB4_9SPHI|nr:RagB/SusD family nutrient uptake outer membrane protein [Sphingobacterium psychroaquaticum]SMG30057.1 Starch-binding associating with outer membrane [Sphingobacterium psychroaquaticum]